MRLTGVWTIFILCRLIFLMVPAMSTSPSFSICSSTVSIAIRVPVRPTPALWGQNDTMTPLHTYTLPPPPSTHLQCARIGPLLPSCWDLTFLWKARREVAYSGTPWSGQPVKWNWVTFLAADPESCGGSIWCKDWGHIQGLIYGFASASLEPCLCGLRTSWSPLATNVHFDGLRFSFRFKLG